MMAGTCGRAKKLVVVLGDAPATVAGLAIMPSPTGP